MVMGEAVLDGRGVPASGGRDTIKGIILLFAQVLPVMAVVSLFPAMPRLFATFGAVPHASLLIPMIITVPSLCIALLSPLAGWIADRAGRRVTLNAALALYAATGLVPLLTDSLAVIIVSRALLGVAEACIVTVASTLVADYFGEGRYRWLAWLSAVQSICGTLLIAVGGMLADISWRGPFVIYAAAIPLFLLGLVFLDEPTSRASRDEPGAVGGFPWKVAASIGIVTLVASVLYYVEPLHVAAVMQASGAGSATRIGLIQAITSVAYILGAFLYKRIYDRPTGTLLGIAGLFIGLGGIGIGLSHDYVTVGIFAAVQQFGAGMVIPALLAWGQSQLPFEQRGRGMGIWAMFFFAGLFFCPPLTGLVGAGVGGLQPAFVTLGAVTIALALLAFLVARRQVAA